MENNTLQQFFEVLSSKIMNCFLPKNNVSKLDFFKLENAIRSDSCDRLGMITRSSLRFFAMILLYLIGVTSWAQNGTNEQSSNLKSVIAYTDVTAYTNKVIQPWTRISTQKSAINQSIKLDATELSSGSNAMKPQTANLDQIRNGSPTSPITPGSWVNGNAGATQAHYAEGWSIPYRIVMTNLTVGVEHTVIIEWDIKHSSKNALDYITHYDNIDNPVGSHQATFGHTQEVIDPTIGVSGLGTPNTFPILAPGPVAGIPPTSFNALPAAKKLMTIYNGTVGGNPIVYISEGDLNASQSSTRMSITFTATNATVVLAWAGHIAAEYDWGAGNAAPSVSGSPYHTRLISLDGSGGNQDRSLAAAAVVSPPVCLVGPVAAVCPDAASITVSSTGVNSGTVSYAWLLINNTAGAQINGSTTGSSISVGPIGTAFTSGSFDAQLTVTKNGAATVCSTTVTINAIPAAPSLKITHPSLCGTSTTGSIEVCNPVVGYTYKLYLNGVFSTSITAIETTPVKFDNLAAASNPSVTVTSAGGCTSGPANCSTATAACGTGKTTQTIAPKETVIASKTELAGFDAYPVPFKDVLTVKYNFDYVSEVKIEVFNPQGIRVLSKTDTNGYLGKEIALDLKMNSGRQQVYIVKVTTNQGSSSKKVISSK